MSTPHDNPPTDDQDHGHGGPPNDHGEHGQAHDYEIVVNLRERHVDHDELTFAEIVALAPGLPSGADVTFTVTFTDARGPRTTGTLTPGHTVRIKKNGTTFNVRATRKS